MSKNISPATAQRRNEEGVMVLEHSSLRLCAVAGEIL
jgi:hypothetical protein